MLGGSKEAEGVLALNIAVCEIYYPKGMPYFDTVRIYKQLMKVKMKEALDVREYPTTPDEAYQKTHGDFGWALHMMRHNYHMAREGWNDKDMCIFLIKGRKVEYNTFQSWKNNANKAYDPPFDVIIQDHIDMKAADGTYVTGWLASQADMLAEDWYIVR